MFHRLLILASFLTLLLHKVVHQCTWGVVGYLKSTLLQTVSTLWRWNFFKNLSILVEIMTNIHWCTFLTRGVQTTSTTQLFSSTCTGCRQTFRPTQQSSLASCYILPTKTTNLSKLAANAISQNNCATKLCYELTPITINNNYTEDNLWTSSICIVYTSHTHTHTHTDDDN